MRHSCTLLVLSIASLTIGCQQAPNASSPLTPVGTLTPELAPVSATAPAFGRFGGRTRIPPPATGSYAVPNNYMGGSTALGQVGISNQPVDRFRGTSGVQAAGFADAPAGKTVAPTSFGAGFQAPAAPANQPSPMQPQLGGMRVQDLTGAPLPPGYRGPAAVVPNQPQPQAVPGGFTPSVVPSGQGARPFNSPPPVQIPNRIPGADIARGHQPAVSIAQRPGAASFSNEVPRQSSPLQPSFNGASQFQSQTPSTDPVNGGSLNPSPDLPWRRPTSAY